MFLSFSPEQIYYGLGIVILLISSGLISGSEVAFFSLEKDSEFVSENKKIQKLLNKPEELLASILIANNIINVAIVIITEIFLNITINFYYFASIGYGWVELLVKIIIVTSFLLLFGEILPKVYASQESERFSGMMSGFMYFLNRRLRIFSRLLSTTAQAIDRGSSKLEVSVNDLSQAIELTSEEGEEFNDQMILKGIAKFGNTDARQIMTPRMDVLAIDIQTSFPELLQIILTAGYSRIPVYQDSLDQIKGVIYIKDLLPYLRYDSNFRWQVHLREVYYIPESKKIDDLLQDFQARKQHIAIVLDEYGGTHGIVTLEDVLEEIVGDIRDEFDHDEVSYSKIDDKNYIFEGKLLVKDFYRIIPVNEQDFEEQKGDSETLAGFILEIYGKLPKVGDIISFQHFDFTIEAMDKRRITQIKCTIND